MSPLGTASQSVSTSLLHTEDRWCWEKIVYKVVFLILRCPSDCCEACRKSSAMWRSQEYHRLGIPLLQGQWGRGSWGFLYSKNKWNWRRHHLRILEIYGNEKKSSFQAEEVLCGRALCGKESRNAWRGRGEEAEDLLCKAQSLTKGQPHTSASLRPPGSHCAGMGGCVRRQKMQSGQVHPVVCQTAGKIERCFFMVWGQALEAQGWVSVLRSTAELLCLVSGPKPPALTCQ